MFCIIRRDDKQTEGLKTNSFDFSKAGEPFCILTPVVSQNKKFLDFKLNIEKKRGFENTTGVKNSPCCH